MIYGRSEKVMIKWFLPLNVDIKLGGQAEKGYLTQMRSR